MHRTNHAITVIRQAYAESIGVNGRPIPIRVDRWQLAKLRWRGVAADEREFGFDLETPLVHGDVIWANDYGYYVIQQTPEPVLVITSHEITQTAAISWSIGNLHQALQINGHELVVADDPAVRTLCQQQHIPFECAHRVFQPMRAVLGHSHHHHD